MSASNWEPIIPTFTLPFLDTRRISFRPTSERPKSANVALRNFGRSSQPASKSMNVCRIASAAATQELNALCLRSFGKALERVSWKLNGLHFVWELRQTGQAGSRLDGPERSGLSCNRNADRRTHLASDG